MRYHHGYGCYGHGDPHCGLGPGPVYGHGPGYGLGRGAQDDDPLPYRRRGRFGGAVARQSNATQLGSYLAFLRDEIGAVERDLRDLGMAEDAGAGKSPA